MPAVFVTTEPSGAPMRSSWREEAAVGVELAPGLERDRVQAALGVGQLDAVADLERSAPSEPVGVGLRRRNLARILRLDHER